MAETEAQLAKANHAALDCQAQIESGDAAISDLQAQITEAEAALTAANDESASQKAELEAQIASLNADLAAEQTALAEAEAERQAAQAEFEQRLSELRAYRVEREMSAGESYLATQTGDLLVFDENGLPWTPRWSTAKAAPMMWCSLWKWTARSSTPPASFLPARALPRYSLTRRLPRAITRPWPSRPPMPRTGQP